VLYIVASSLVVTIPVSLYLTFGDRADDLIARSKAWITANGQMLAFATALAFGALLTLDASIRLAA
jgi:hypothetical protein